MIHDRDERQVLEQQARERLLDAVLAEVVRGEPRHALAPPPRATSRWFSAALLLLGTGVAVAVVILGRQPPPAPAQEPAPESVQDPGPALPPEVRIADPAALATLDRATPNLFLEVAGPNDLAPLAEFTALRRLVLEPRDAGVLGGKADAPGPDGWPLTPLAKCAQLRSLTIGLLRGFEPDDLDAVAALPDLRELQFIGVSHVVDAAFGGALAKLPLRSLELLAVRIDPKGFAGLCQLPLLERLVLRDCLHVPRCDLTQLGRLRSLRCLELRGVGGRFADSLGKTNPLPGEPETPLPPEAEGPGAVMRSGLQMPGENKLVLSVAAVQAVAGLPALRELSLAGSVVDDAVLQALPRTLTGLDLTGTIGLTAAGLGAVVRLPDLVGFGCSNFAVDDPLEHALAHSMGPAHPLRNQTTALVKEKYRLLFEVIRAHRLHQLRFHGTLTPELVAALSGLPELRELEIVLLGDADPKLDLSFAPTLPKLERLSITGGTRFDPAPLAQCRSLRRVQLVRVHESMIDVVQQTVGPEVDVQAAERRVLDK